MNNTVLRCRNIGKTFNGSPVLDSVNINLLRSEVTGIVGPSGCGKTTILRIIAGLENPSKGKLIPEIPEAGIAFNFQEPRLIPWLSALDNIAFVLKKRIPIKNIRKRHAIEALQSVELEEYAHFFPDQLSGGMKQRVSLARALAFDPDIFLMDEPFAGLDFPLRMQLISLFNSILEQHSMSVVFVSHDTREIVRLCDKVYILNGKPCKIRETIDLGPKHERFIHPGYIQKMEEHMLEIMSRPPIQ